MGYLWAKQVRLTEFGRQVLLFPKIDLGRICGSGTVQGRHGLHVRERSRIHFGLGKRTKIESLEITWPGGQVDRLTNVPVDEIIAVKEGTGILPRNFPKVPSR